MDGDFSIEVAAAATERVIAACYKALSDHHVMLEGTLLKPNMVRSGSDAVPQASSKEIALATVRVLQVRQSLLIYPCRFVRTSLSSFFIYPSILAHCSLRRPRHHLPVRRHVRGGSVPLPERDQQRPRPAPLVADLLLRTRSAAVLLEGVAGTGRQHSRGSGSAAGPRSRQ